MDLLAKSGENSYPADLKTWHHHLDSIILMTYDYHRSSSSVAGPISPLYAQNPQSHAIIKNLQQISTKIPLEKILIGIPFYGYRWQTVEDTFLSQTFPNTGSTIQYKDIKILKVDSLPIDHWNPITFTPWLVGSENDQYFQIHYESPRSIAHKVELVTSAHLNGIAIWALGYEGNDKEIWL